MSATLDARAVPAVAWLDELRESPALLHRWCEAFGDADDATLAVLVPDGDDTGLDWLARELEATGSTADVLAVPVAGPAHEQVAVAAACAVLTGRGGASALRQVRRVVEMRTAWDCDEVAGRPILRQPALLVGAGRVEFGERVTIGWERSPGFHATYTGNPGGDVHANPQWRNFMSKEPFAHYPAKEGLEVVSSRVIDWSEDAQLDCLTLLRNPAR